MFLSRQMTESSLNTIGEAFGDATTAPSFTPAGWSKTAWKLTGVFAGRQQPGKAVDALKRRSVQGSAVGVRSFELNLPPLMKDWHR